MVQSRQFHIGDILSITTGSLVSPRGIDGVYDILGFMTGESLFTHQLPRAGDECKPYLLGQHPQLADVDASGVNVSNFASWLAEQVAKYGEILPVQPLPSGVRQLKDPIEELVEMRGSAEGIILTSQD